jgi:hypothetical protein
MISETADPGEGLRRYTSYSCQNGPLHPLGSGPPIGPTGAPEHESEVTPTCESRSDGRGRAGLRASTSAILGGLPGQKDGPSSLLRARRILLDTGMHGVSNECSGEPGGFRGKEVNAQGGNPGPHDRCLDGSRAVRSGQCPSVQGPARFLSSGGSASHATRNPPRDWWVAPTLSADPPYKNFLDAPLKCVVAPSYPFLRR